MSSFLLSLSPNAAYGVNWMLETKYTPDSSWIKHVRYTFSETLLEVQRRSLGIIPPQRLQFGLKESLTPLRSLSFSLQGTVQTENLSPQSLVSSLRSRHRLTCIAPNGFRRKSDRVRSLQLLSNRSTAKVLSVRVRWLLPKYNSSNDMYKA